MVLTFWISSSVGVLLPRREVRSSCPSVPAELSADSVPDAPLSVPAVSASADAVVSALPHPGSAQTTRAQARSRLTSFFFIVFPPLMYGTFVVWSNKGTIPLSIMVRRWSRTVRRGVFQQRIAHLFPQLPPLSPKS